MKPAALATEEKRKLDLYQSESDKMAVYRDKQQQEVIARHEENEKKKKEKKASIEKKIKEDEQFQISEMTSMAARQASNSALLSSSDISSPTRTILSHYGGNYFTLKNNQLFNYVFKYLRT